MGTKIAHRMKTLLLGLISLAVLAGLVWGLYTVLAHLMTLNPNVSASIIAACATVLVATLSVLLSKHFEIQKLVFKEHRDKKIPIYEDLVRFFFRVMFKSKKGKPLSQSEMASFFQDFVQKATVWGSDDVLKAFGDFKRHAPEIQAGADPTKILFLSEKLLFAIRRDLGHKNKNLKQGDLLSLFVTDIDQHLH